MTQLFAVKQSALSEAADADASGASWFRSFHAAHCAFVREAVAHLTGDQRSEIDDVCQEVFLVALRKWPSFAARGAEPRGFLRGVAAREVQSHRRWRRVQCLVGFIATPDVSDGTTPETVFADRQASAHLYRCLDQLSEKRRTVLILHEIDGLSGEEIAGLLHIPVATVWTRLFHGRRALERILGARWGARWQAGER